MRVEQRDDGALVSGYLDTDSADRDRAFDTVLVCGTEPYQAEMRPHRFGALNACDISGGSQVRVLPRTSPSARTDGHLLGMLLAGQGTMEQDGRRAPLAPGDLVLYCGKRPFRLELTSPYRYFVLSLMPGVADFLPHASTAFANPELAHSSSGRVLAATLAEIAGLAARMGPLTRQEMGEHVTCMLRTLIHEADRRGVAVPCTRAAVLDQVLHHIDENLGSDLSPESIAAAEHISVRHLHTLFQRQGDTVGRHVRRRRLNRIRRDLADPDLAHRPAQAIAARWGIHNPSHFSKLFRSEFGVSPREFREQVRTGSRR